MLLGGGAAPAHEEHEPGAASRGAAARAPAPGRLGFVPPEPGSYTLPPLGPAADGAVLDVHGKPTTLHERFGDGLVLLSFVYASCGDARGCPLATATLHEVQQRLEADPALAARLRLLTLSFDPVRDTPEAMARYGASFRGGGLDWSFLTTRSRRELAPILEAYGQQVVEERDAEGRSLGTFAHVLRVFLIDADRRIRNVYSVSFLHPDVLLSDVRTLLGESDPAAAGSAAGESAVSVGPGDVRDGYDDRAWRTRSRALDTRGGRSTDLLGRALNGAPGLPPLPVPADNPLTKEKVALGRKLFFDRRLSANGTLSCAMCHVPEHGFTHNETATAVGIEGRTVRRNAPTLLDVGFVSQLFVDGREPRLERQIWGPLLADNEMGNESVGDVLARLASLADYEGLFESAFPGRGRDEETVGMALASYQRTLVTGGSAFDRWRYAGDEQALGESARRGFALFSGRAGCSGCHRIGPDAALFSDDAFHNTGVGWVASQGSADPTERIAVGPGRWLRVDRAIVAAVAEPAPRDLGRYEVTGDPADRWRYRTPSLRNVALTAPYMHDGSLASLSEVVRFYDRGGVANPGLDPRVRPLGLSESERRDLVAFLESLTGGDVAVLVSDALAAPVGDPGS
ncbi:MAG: cytochrome c peroxidase [Myxococcota bacterium]